MDDLGNMMTNYCTILPGGMVIFFPSYTYMESVHKYWSNNGIIDLIRKTKQVFMETRNASADTTLKDYSRGVSNVAPNTHFMSNFFKGGAIILCVVGGKLSEGINFSDELARAVFMIGLPFGNMKSKELKEKIKYHSVIIQ